MAQPLHRHALLAPDRGSLAVAAVRGRRGTWTVSLLTSTRHTADTRTDVSDGTDDATPAPAVTLEEYLAQVYTETNRARSDAGLAPLEIAECASGEYECCR